MSRKSRNSAKPMDIPVLHELDRSRGSEPLYEYLDSRKIEFLLIQRKGKQSKLEVDEPLDIAAAWLEYGTRYQRQMRPDRRSEGLAQLQEILRLAKTADRKKTSFRALISKLSRTRLNWFARLQIITAVGCGESEDEPIMAESLEKVRSALRDKNPEKRRMAITSLIQAIEPAVRENSWAKDLGGRLVPDQPARTLIRYMAHAYWLATGECPTHFNPPPARGAPSNPNTQVRGPRNVPDRTPAPFTALMRAIGKSVTPPISDTKLDRLIRQTIPRADGSMRARKRSV